MQCLPAASAVLIAVAVGACASEPVTPRLVWSGPGVTLLGGPSRDGKYLSYADPRTGNLGIRDVATGVHRELTSKPPGSKEFAYFSTIAPDSRRVAYAWFNEEGYYDLRVIGLDGANRRILYRNEEARFVQPCAWSSDSKFILTLLFRTDNISQIAMVPADGSPLRVLRSLNWVYPKRMDLSPDGKSIVYDSFANESSGDRTLYLLAVDGARERKLISRPGNHLFPLWTADGRRVVYASDASGTMDLWELDIANGAAQGEPRLLRRDLGRFLPMGITAANELYFGLRSGSSDVFVTTLGAPARDARRATLRFPGRNSAPAWSPDGNSLAYLSRRGTENFGQESRAIVVRSLEAEEERELLPKLAHIERVRWAPGGESLLVSGSDNKGRGGVYSVDARTAEVKALVTEAGAPFTGFEAEWSRDGESLFYIENGMLRTRDAAGRQGSILYHGERLSHLTASPDGKWLAATSEAAILLIPAAGGEARSIPFPGATELDWGRFLIAGKGAELWRIPADESAPAKLDSPGNRSGPFSLHPDGKRIALAAGDQKSEIWAAPLD